MKLLILLSLFSFEVFSASTSPFTDISFENMPSVMVEVSNEKYYLLSVNGTRRAEIIKLCEQKYAEECPCMFAEKFSEMMDAIGLPITNTVNLSLYYFPTHSIVNLNTHASTEENSETIIESRFMRNEACYE